MLHHVGKAFTLTKKTPGVLQGVRLCVLSSPVLFSLWETASSLQFPQDIRELKQTRRRRKRERHLKMSLRRVSAIIFQLVKVIMFQKAVLTILQLNLYPG